MSAAVFSNMEDEMLLRRPSDRRLLDDNNIYPGPPGAENDSFEIDQKWNIKETTTNVSKRNKSKERAPARSKSRERKSRSRSRERRRSRSRSRSRSFSPDDRKRRRFSGRNVDMRDKRRPRSRGRSPDRSKDRIDRRGRDRSRENSRERYNRNYDNRRSGGGRRSRSQNRNRREWSPINKSNIQVQPILAPPQPSQVVQGSSYIPPPTMYNDNYSNYGNNLQYGNVLPQQYNAYDYGPQNSGQPPPPPGYAPNYPPPQSVHTQPIPPGDDFSAATWGVPPPPHITQPTSVQQPQVPPPPLLNVKVDEEKLKRDAAVVQEMQNQRATLCKQREDYRRRAGALKRELKILKEQRTELVTSSSGPPSPTSKSFLKENDRLQSQIQTKLKTIENVIDMLTGIIGEERTPSPPPPPSPTTASMIPTAGTIINENIQFPNKQATAEKTEVKKIKKDKSGTHTPESNDSSPERLKTKVIESLNKSKRENKKIDNDNNNKELIEKDNKTNEKSQDASKIVATKKINYVHYDPEMHWCQTCDVFPKTAKDYLTHLHSSEHQNKIKVIESPWHGTLFTDEMPTFSNAPTKRTPIRGLQFFVQSTSWFCKLCSIWMGDLHCASLHLKSKTHAEKYNEFIEQNPHFEIDWMSDRQRAYEQSREKNLSVAENVLPVPPPPPTINQSTTSSLFEGIPLQLASKGMSFEPILQDQVKEEVSKSQKSKVKKNKKKSHDDNNESSKRDKKKKKKSKKRKRHHSSTSSSTSENTSDTDVSDKKSISHSDSQPHDELNEKKNSIRVAMRNLLKTNANQKIGKDESGGKWTMIQPPQSSNINMSAVPAPVPPPTAVATITAPNVTEMIINKDTYALSTMPSAPLPVEPIISEQEKKLFDELKTKNNSNNTKKRSNDDDHHQSRFKNDRDYNSRNDDRNDRYRDSRTSRYDYHNRRNNNNNSFNNSGRRRGSRSPIRNRRSRSRSKTPTITTRRYRNSRRSYSRSHSRSRERRVIEKPVINYPPEMRHKIEKKTKSNKNLDENGERRNKSPSSKKLTSSTTTTNTNSNKKLPFIGRMPVFKKQTQLSEGDEMKKDDLMDLDEQQQLMLLQQPPPPPPPYEQPSADGLQTLMMEDDDDLMPDPDQLMAIMNARPTQLQRMEPNKPDEVLPPGIDENEADSVPKPISDAPIPRKGPLPKDFQDALNIIFPGEKKPGTEEPLSNPILQQPPPPTIEAEPQPIVIIEQNQMLEPIMINEDISQQSLDMYNAYAAAYNASAAAVVATTLYGGIGANNVYDQVPQVEIPEIVPPPSGLIYSNLEIGEPTTDIDKGDKEINISEEVIEHTTADMSEDEEEEKDPRQDELDDLAMLGIDASDLAAQCM